MKKPEAVGSKLLVVTPEWNYHCVIFKVERNKVQGAISQVLVYEGDEVAGTTS